MWRLSLYKICRLKYSFVTTSYIIQAFSYKLGHLFILSWLSSELVAAIRLDCWWKLMDPQAAWTMDLRQKDFDKSVVVSNIGMIFRWMKREDSCRSSGPETNSSWFTCRSQFLFDHGIFFFFFTSLFTVVWSQQLVIPWRKKSWSCDCY